jgi:ribosome-associated protein
LHEAPGADRQHLRTLARRAEQELRDNRPPAAARALFKALRELLAEVRRRFPSPIGRRVARSAG